MDRPTYWIGVDLASETFTTSVLREPGTPVLVREQVPNTPEGIAGFVGELKAQQITPSNAVVVLDLFAEQELLNRVGELDMRTGEVVYRLEEE